MTEVQTGYNHFCNEEMINIAGRCTEHRPEMRITFGKVTKKLLPLTLHIEITNKESSLVLMRQSLNKMLPIFV